DLLSAGAGSFERATWVVEPHIDALHKKAANVDVVVLDEYKLFRELGVAHQLRNLLQDLLAGLVVRMGFSGKYKLHRTLGVVDHQRQPLNVRQNEVGALVGCEATRESDGERIRRKQFAQRLQRLLRFAASFRLLTGPAADELNHPGFQRQVRLPQLAIVDGFNAFPSARCAALPLPADAEMTIVEAAHLRSKPRGYMNAICDVANRHGVLRLLRVKRPPHRPRNLAVQGRHRIGAAGKFEPQDRHAELFLVVVGAHASEAHQIIVREAKLITQGPQMLFDEIGIEAVVTGRDRGVRGEDDFARNLARGGHKIHALFLHATANRLENCEAAVAFVQMKHSRRDAHGSECTEAAHAQQKFLAYAGAAIAAIEARGEIAIFRRIALHIRIQQKKIAPSDLRTPDLGADRAASCLNFDHDRFAILADRRLYGALVDVRVNILFLLPAAAVETLQEVALAVEQTYADEWNVEIGRTLDVIAGQHAESAGIDGQRFVQSEFSREICNWACPQQCCMFRAPGVVGLHILLLAAVDIIDAAVQGKFRGPALDLAEGKFIQKCDRILIQFAPARGVEIAKKGDAF